MKTLGLDSFADYFQAVHKRKPFRWQTMLMEEVATKGWPDLIDLPTASGKTACLDIAVFALAMGLRSPRRIWFVVDRRIVVDEAYRRAESIAQALHAARNGVLAAVRQNLLALAGRDDADVEAAPLGVARLRGGAPRQVAWSRNPVQPAIITSTIDQVGSRLLFRGYGVGDRMKPIHAALAGNDSLIVLDEAHLAKPFIETVQAVARFRGQPWAHEPIDTPFKLVIMSATPPKDGTSQSGEAQPVIFPPPAARAKALSDELLQRRMNASKPAALALAAKPKVAKGQSGPLAFSEGCEDLVLDAAQRALDYVKAGRGRVAVMVNRVKTAQQIVAQVRHLLAAGAADAQVALLTGRLRPVDRDAFIERYEPLLKSGSPQTLERPIILVTTQCLEVGADFSFDALVTECASIDALRQRFGRLNRLGEIDKNPAPAVILIREVDTKPAADIPTDSLLDPVYGNALARTWNWLQALGKGSVDMGVSVLQPALDKLAASGRMESLLAPTRQAPIMLPAYVDLWAQTNPRPSIEPDVALFLHGVPPPEYRPRADVRVLWRNEMSAEALEAAPPLSMEMLTLPLRELRASLGAEAPAPADDFEGGIEKDEKPGRDAAPASDVRLRVWRYGELLDALVPMHLLRPDDVIVLPADGPSFQRLCLTAEAPSTIDAADGAAIPPDAYEVAYWRTKNAPLIRYPAAFHGHGAGSAPQTWAEDEEPESGDILAAADAAIQAMPAGPYRRALLEIGAAFDKRRKAWLTCYGAGRYLITQTSKNEPVADWGFEIDADDEERSTSSTSGRYLLGEHSQTVAQATSWLSKSVATSFSSALAAAAALHDVGKADPRFQDYLAGGRNAASGLLAKSREWRCRERDRKLRKFFHVPNGFRHEMTSMLLAAADHRLTDSDRDLVLHLIASHHGYARPFAPVVDDPTPPDVSVNGITLTGHDRTAAPAHRLDSGVGERFWALTRRYGWWGVVYLEAILRCSDQRASALVEANIDGR